MTEDGPPTPNPGLRAGTLALILASGAMLGVALFLPTVTYERIAAERETYSILGGIRSLWKDGDYVLAGLVFGFSVVWPIAKLLLLTALWFGWRDAPWRARFARVLRRLGKWSLLDVFVIGLFVGAVQLGALAAGSSRWGIVLFLGAILLSMLAAVLVERMQGQPAHVLERTTETSGWGLRLVSLAALGAVVVGVAMPLFKVQKAVIFANYVELMPTTLKLVEVGERVLAATLVLFVVVATVARAAVLVVLRFRRGGGARSLWIADFLGEWAMLDVFTLGMLIVQTKLDDIATTTRLEGFWFAVVGAILTNLDAFLWRREVRARPR